MGGLVALDQRRQAVREQHIAVARELAAAADANILDDPERSILLALAAVDATRRYDEPVLPEALEALHRGVASARILRSFPGVGGAMDWSADGRLFVTEGTEESGIVDIRDAVTGETVQKFRADKIDLNGVAFSPDSKRVVTAGDEGSVRVWDIATGRKLGDVTVGSEGQPWGLSVSPDGRLVAASWHGRQGAGLPRHGRQALGDRRRSAVRTPRSAPTADDSRSARRDRRGARLRREVSPRGAHLRQQDVRHCGHCLEPRRAADRGGPPRRCSRARCAHRSPAAGDARGTPATCSQWRGARTPAGSPPAATDGTARVFAVDRNAAHEVVRLSAQDLRSGVARWPSRPTASS